MSSDNRSRAVGQFFAPHAAENVCFNGYRILQLLGEGGTGSVFQATQISTGQIVALKLLRQGNAPDEFRRQRLIDRFDREAQLCAQLHHPHIVRLLDKGQTDDLQLFAVFEFVPGETLKDLLLRKGALTAIETGELMGQVMDALACAHALGIVHRDLKPHNIMVTSTGTRSHVKVLDFGTAAFIPTHQEPDYRNLTLTQEALGTPSYSAPEQLRGEPPTTKTDLYAWGLLVIECLTGRPAIQGITLAEIFHKQLSPMDVPLPPALVGHPLADLLRRVLHKNPRDRAEQAATLYADFRKLNLANIVGNLNQVPQQRCDHDVEQDTANALTRDWFPGWLNQRYERRQMTVLCCSLFVASCTDTEPELEALDALQQDQLSLCTDTASRYGAHLAGSLGDSLMFYYGYPYASDNDARRAARTALELVGQVRRRSRLLEIQQGIKLEISIGIHTGIVLTRPGHPPTGLTPNIALRLKQLAAPGTVLVSGAARQLLQQHIEFEESGCNPIGSSSRALPVFLLTAEYSAEAFSFLRGGNNNPLAGRALELQSLLQRWNAAKTAQGHATLLIGEAGIGKSRLAWELCRVVRNDGLITRECRCLPEHRNNALHPILQMLKAHLQLQEISDGALAAARIQSALESCECNVEWVMPILCSWLSLPIPEQFPALQHSADRQKEILLDALQQLVSRSGNGAPFLLVVEDIHWMDQTSLELIERLINLAPRHAFFLVLTARPEFLQGRDSGMVDTINLARLSSSDCEKMIFKILDGKPIDKKSLSTISERVDGIPLFVEEFTRMLLDNQLLVERDGLYRLDEKFDSGAIPITLRDSLTERLGRLGGARETAQLAATIGREFEHALLVDVSLRDEGAVQTDLEQLIAADLIYRQRRVHGDSYIFRHALIRDAAYDAMPKYFREQTHARIAQALEIQTPAEVERNLAQLAWHFANAAGFANATKYGTKAAQVSLERALNEDAITHANGVLSWIDRLDPDERLEAELNINRILTHALMSKYGWADSRVKSRAERSLQLLEAANNAQHMLSALWALTFYHHMAGHRVVVRGLTPQLIDLSSNQEDEGPGIAAHTLFGVACWIDGRYTEAEQALEYVVQHYDLKRDGNHCYRFGVDSRIWALSSMASVRWFQDADNTAAFACARQAVSDARQLNHIPAIGVALTHLALVHQYEGDCESVMDVCNQLLEFAQKYGFPAFEAYACIIRGWANSNLAEAEAMLNGLQAMGCMLAMTYYASLPADIEARSGDFTSAIERIDRCIALCGELDEHYYEAELFRRRAIYRAQENASGNRNLVESDLIKAVSHAQKRGMRKIEALARKELKDRFGLCDAETGELEKNSISLI